MQSCQYKRFNFLGLSFSLSAFGVLAGVVSVIARVLCIILFIPLYPLWCWSAIKNWDKLSVVHPYDWFVHFWSGKPRVFDMTKWEWKALLVIWIFCSASIPFVISLKGENERLRRENDRSLVMQRERNEQERYQMRLDGEVPLDERCGINDNESAKPVGSYQPSEELEYYDEHFDDYRDDPEDGVTYPDEIFDFYDD